MFGKILEIIDRGHLPSEPYIEWVVKMYGFLLRRFGGIEKLRQAPVYLPTPEFFDVRTDWPDEKIASAFFEQVRTYCGMADWPVTLQSQGELVEHIGLGMVTRQGAAGTYVRRGGSVVITYSPEQVKDPMALVATFAHELAHYLLDTIDEVTPGGRELEEHATDLTAVFMGFGVFLANAAFTFEQHCDGDRQGWSYSRQGYLSEVELAFALATFATLTDTPTGEFDGFLDSNPKAALRAGMRYLERNDFLIEEIENEGGW